ncbi:MAG: glycosyltransferase family A protein [Nitrososphaerales archaeon]
MIISYITEYNNTCGHTSNPESLRLVGKEDKPKPNTERMGYLHSMDSDYWCCIVTRDGADTISATIDSMIKQTAPPKFVVVVNDGSADNTEEIVKQKSEIFQSIYVVRTNSKARDIRRVPKLLNFGLDYAKKLPKTSYMMVSGDDNELALNYSEKIMERMDGDQKLVVASGDWLSSRGRSNQMPHGGGRFVKTSFMEQIGGKYPVAYGWETWLLYKAMEMGYKVKLYADLRYVHLRPFHPGNLFGWGRAMYSLGFPTYFVFMRFLVNFLWSRRGTQSMKASVTMIVGYLSAKLNPDAVKGMLIEDEGLKTFVRRFSATRLTRLL